MEISVDKEIRTQIAHYKTKESENSPNYAKTRTEIVYFKNKVENSLKRMKTAHSAQERQFLIIMNMTDGNCLMYQS